MVCHRILNIYPLCYTVHKCKLNCVQLFVTPWSVAHQAPLSMGFSRQEYWSGLPCPPPGGLPNLGIEPMSTALQADSFTTEPLGKPRLHCTFTNFFLKIFYFGDMDPF